MYTSRGIFEKIISNAFNSKAWRNKTKIMTSCFKVHNIKISLKLESPSLMYFNNTITKNKKIKQKNFGNFRIVYSNFTYIFFNTTTNILHCNVTKINKYNQIHSSKKY